MLLKIYLFLMPACVLFLLQRQAVSEQFVGKRFNEYHRRPFNVDRQSIGDLGRSRERPDWDRPIRPHRRREDRDFEHRQATGAPRRFSFSERRPAPHRRSRFSPKSEPGYIPRFSYMPRHSLSTIGQRQPEVIEHKISPKIQQELQSTWSERPVPEHLDPRNDEGPSSDVEHLRGQNHQKELSNSGSEHMQTVSDEFQQKTPLLVEIKSQSSRTMDDSNKVGQLNEGIHKSANLLSARNEPFKSQENHDSPYWSSHSSDGQLWKKEDQKFDEKHQPSLLHSSQLQPSGVSNLPTSNGLIGDMAAKHLVSHPQPELTMRNEKGPMMPADIHGMSPINRHSNEHSENTVNHELSPNFRKDNSAVVDHNGGPSVGRMKDSKENNAWVNVRLHMDETGALNVEMGPSSTIKTNNMFTKDSFTKSLDPHFKSEMPHSNGGFVGGRPNHEAPRSSPDSQFERPFFSQTRFEKEPWMAWRGNPRNGPFPDLSNEPMDLEDEPRRPHLPHLPPHVRHGGIRPAAAVWKNPRFEGPESDSGPHGRNAKLLFESTSDDSKQVIRKASGHSQSDLNDQHKTTILDSIPFEMNIANGCPAQKCSKACPGDLKKLSPQTGCPTCECCPTVSCQRLCPLGYDADDSGCPTCQCLQL